jgi:hypothetical protein
VSVKVLDRAKQIREIILDIESRMTLRQCFYQFVVRQILPNTKSAYRAVGRAKKVALRLGLIEPGWIVDRSRRVWKSRSWAGMREFIEHQADLYQIDYWRDSPVRVEVWLEKEALADVVFVATNEYNVPLYPCKGYAGDAFLEEAIEELDRDSRPVFIGYTGDWDPSGEDMERVLREKLGHANQVVFERIAILEDDIRRYNLPTQKVKSDEEALRLGKKKRGDPRARGFLERHGDQTVELDALRPDELQRRVRKFIEQHVDLDWWERMHDQAERERETFRAFSDRFKPKIDQDTKLESEVRARSA